MKKLVLLAPVAAILMACEQPRITSPISYDGINFGLDGSQWANDGECDDPRFKGIGVDEILLEEDTRMDATDCLNQYRVGNVKLR